LYSAVGFIVVRAFVVEGFVQQAGSLAVIAAYIHFDCFVGEGVVAHFDLFTAQGGGDFVEASVEAEGGVAADAAGGFVEEEAVEVLAGCAQVDGALSETPRGALAFEGGVDRLVVVFFQPGVAFYLFSSPRIIIPRPGCAR
jgi:hypothetical protein